MVHRYLSGSGMHHFSALVRYLGNLFIGAEAKGLRGRHQIGIGGFYPIYVCVDLYRFGLKRNAKCRRRGIAAPSPERRYCPMLILRSGIRGSLKTTYHRNIALSQKLMNIVWPDL